MDDAEFPAHLTRSGSFDLPLPLARAFPLFTAEGERGWVPGWEPSYLHPALPSNERGTVFRTHHGDEETIWIVLRHEPSRGIAEYARFTPGSRLGTVCVECEDIGASLTRVSVTYSLTALSDAGRRALGAMDPASYEGMLAEWRRLILGSVAGG